MKNVEHQNNLKLLQMHYLIGNQFIQQQHDNHGGIPGASPYLYLVCVVGIRPGVCLVWYWFWSET